MTSQTGKWHRRTAALALIAIAALGLALRGSDADAAQEAAFTGAQTKAGLKLFDDHVRDILAKECVPCHGGKHKEGELDLTTRDSLLKGGLTDKAIVPGSADDSLLVWLIRHEEEPYMPEDAPQLRDEQIAHIAAWIDAGAPYSAPLPKTVQPPD